MFHDDDFVLPDVEAMWTRVRALRRELDRNGVGRIAFAIKSRPDAVGAGLFAYLKEMGQLEGERWGHGYRIADPAAQRAFVPPCWRVATLKRPSSAGRC